MNAQTRTHAPPQTDATYLVVIRGEDGTKLHDLNIAAGNHGVARDRAIEQLRAQGHVIPVGAVFDTGRLDPDGLPTQRRRQMEMGVETMVVWRPPAKRGKS